MRRSCLAIAFLLLPLSVSAQVAHDASCESTLTQSVSSHTCSLTASASTKGILVFTFNINTANDNFTGVTDGSGTPLTAVPSCSGADTAGEPGGVKAWFLGSGVTTGTQTITAARTSNTDQGYMIAVSVTAGGNTETNGCVVVQENAVPAEQDVTDGSLGTNSVRYAAAYYGLTAAGMTDGANSTRLQDASSGSQGLAAWRETTAGQGSRPVGFTGVSDDLAAVYLAVRQVAAAGSGAKQLLTLGVGLW